MGASAITGGLGLGASLFQTIEGAKEKRQAEDALNAYERQPLTNVANGLQVSTLGSDIQREEQSRLASGQIEGLRGAGTRGLLGGLGKVEAGNQRVMAQTGADLDAQQKSIDMLQAEDQARIRSMQENREIGDISALSSQVQAGKQDFYNGIGTGIQSIGMMGNAFGKTGAGGGDGSMFNVSGTAPDNSDSSAQSPINGANTYNPQNTYGNFFSRNPYTPSQNVDYPDWFNNVSGSLSNKRIY